MKIRMAKETDSADLLKIYNQYIETKTTFEAVLPSETEFSNRITDTLETFPYLVCEENGSIVGYAYAHKYRARAAYQWGAELSIYIDNRYHGKGLGRKLYQVLMDIMKIQGVQMAYAGITYPNEKSQGLHEAIGFKHIGTIHHAGYKCDKWQDVMWFECVIGNLPETPRPITKLNDLPGGVVEKLLSE